MIFQMDSVGNFPVHKGVDERHVARSLSKREHYICAPAVDRVLGLGAAVGLKKLPWDAHHLVKDHCSHYVELRKLSGGATA